MARINLLPWRETRKKEREKRYFTAMGLVAVLSIAAGVGVHMEMEKQSNFQSQRNQFLLQQIAALDLEIKAIKTLEVEKARLLNRMKVIQTLQKSRPEIVHLFEELVLTLPEGAQLLEISQKGPTINIEGVAESNSRISSFMRNMDKSVWLENPELVVIDANKPGYPNASWFSLKVQRSHP
ncbi:MAG TPA: pilus assembly protein PilN [Gammaproteobacteria bacterium]|nr:pilus assembly protein PilN [Gammaproteobacteria bacterium]